MASANASNVPSTFTPEIQWGPYVVEQRLGRGGMAEVFLARMRLRDRDRAVVLKRVLPHLARDRRCVELFTHEADLSKLFSHPNVVRVLDAGTIGEVPFIAMEWIDGRDLSQIIDRCRRLNVQLPIDFAVYLVRSVLQALDYLHRFSSADGRPFELVHCDVTSSNVFISRLGEIKVGDFGVARWLAGARDGNIPGKPHAMSPEMLEGDITPEADLWATGVLLYELLTMQRPFEGKSIAKIFSAVRKGRYVPVRELRPDVPEGLAALIDRAFHSERLERFDSARDFERALEPYWDDRIGTPLAIAAVVRGLFRDDSP